MSATVLVGATLLASSLPVAWLSVAGSRTPTVDPARLSAGTADRDLRQLDLERAAGERAIRPAVAALAGRARRMTPSGSIAALERKLAVSGVTWTIERVLALKLLLGVIGAILGFLRFASAPSLFAFVVAVTLTAGGWFGVELVLSSRADRRRATIQRELPDLLDQVTIAVEAGLGFEAALARVAGTDGVLATELARMLQDIRLGVDRAAALDGLAERTDAADVRHFAMSVRQAERYGLPIANVLRIQSSELREKRKQRAEEHAMKIPVKVLFPLVLCILPALFIVVIGPAVLRVASTSFAG